jgi:hypothetical protein
MATTSKCISLDPVYKSAQPAMKCYKINIKLDGDLAMASACQKLVMRTTELICTIINGPAHYETHAMGT